MSKAPLACSASPIKSRTFLPKLVEEEAPMNSHQISMFRGVFVWLLTSLRLASVVDAKVRKAFQYLSLQVYILRILSLYRWRGSGWRGGDRIWDR